MFAFYNTPFHLLIISINYYTEEVGSKIARVIVISAIFKGSLFFSLHRKSYIGTHPLNGNIKLHWFFYPTRMALYWIHLWLRLSRQKLIEFNGVKFTFILLLLSLWIYIMFLYFSLYINHLLLNRFEDIFT